MSLTYGMLQQETNRTLPLISFHIAVMVAVSDGMVDNGLHNHSELETLIYLKYPRRVTV